MKKVIVQVSVSLDGYMEGPNHEIDWHIVDDEFNAYAAEMLVAADALIMGRRTYELMAGYWPNAAGNHPVVTAQMNSTPKLVFSRTLKKLEWQNSRLAVGSIAEEMALLQQLPGEGLLALGGNELAASFLEQGLVDELRIVLTPILLGGGKTLFATIKQRHPLRLLATRNFKSGNVVLIYEPVRRR